MRRILVVEDDPDVRVLLQHVLVGAQFRVDTVATATRAMALLDLDAYDLVIADAMLRDGTGMMVADIAAKRGIRTLIVTGFGYRYADQLARYDYLLKPVRPSELLDAVERRLGDAQADRDT